VVFGFAAIAAILTGAFTHDVLVDQNLDMTMRCGLRSCDACVERSCVRSTTLELASDTAAGGGKATSAWGWSGTIAWWTSLVAALGLAISLAMVATGRYVRFPVISPTSVALLGGAGALIAGCVFVATKPETIGVTRVGWTFWAFGGGSVGAIVGAFLLSRQLALIEPEFDPGESIDAPPDEPWEEP